MLIYISQAREKGEKGGKEGFMRCQKTPHETFNRLKFQINKSFPVVLRSIP